ncbi:MAG: cation diffusion facilitator family transporter [Oscillospiraceae bacterium]|nr:cation diffusion facilitator family transporter [Oscillospiraceae bacterium]
MEKSRNQIVMRVSRNTLIGNVILSVFKLSAGIAANSAAMVSDAVHSLSDVLSTIVVMIGVKLAGKKSDKEHPYGHERLESAAAIILAAMLFATGLLIGYSGVMKTINSNAENLSIPGGLALVAATISVVAKEAMYWYTRAAAKKTGSGALMADAWHHRSDALSSVGSFVGILGARIGLPILDPLACVVICVFIVKVAVDIFKDALRKMTDTSCDDALVNEMLAVALEQKGVLGVDNITTRLFGDRIFMEIEITADGSSTLDEAHNIAEHVHIAIETRFDKVKHCMVHVNPVNNRKTGS